MGLRRLWNNLLQGTGLQFIQQPNNPGTTDTLWRSNATGNPLYLGSTQIATTETPPASQYILVDDPMCGDALNPYFNTTVNGTGASVALSFINPVIPPFNLGARRCATGTTATGRAAIHGSTSISSIQWASFLGSANTSITFRADFFLPEASDASNRYTLRVGLMNSLTGDSTDGVYARYTDNVNGGDWQFVLRKSNVETVVTPFSGVITPAPPTTQGFVSVTVTYSYTSTLVVSINGTTLSAGDAPINGNTFYPAITVVKSAGTTTRGPIVGRTRVLFTKGAIP